MSSDNPTPHEDQNPHPSFTDISGPLETQELAVPIHAPPGDAFEAPPPTARTKHGRVLVLVFGALLISTTAGIGVWLVGTGQPAEQQEDRAASTALDSALQAVRSLVTPKKGPTDSKSTPSAAHEVSYVPTGHTLPDMIYVDSMPAGAEVRVEGQKMGETPLLRGGHYAEGFAKVSVSKHGYKTWTGKVQVVGGGLRADVTLKPVAR